MGRSRTTRRTLSLWGVVVLLSCGGLVLPVLAADLFAQQCGVCHNKPTDARTPSARMIARMNPLAVLATLETGTMRVQAQQLSALQKRQLVEELTGKTLEALTLPEAAFCESDTAPIDDQTEIYWSGWGGSQTGLGYASAEVSGVTPSTVRKLQLDWAFAFPGVNQARSQPAIVGDVVIVGGAEGSVSALAADSGCIYWRADTTSAVRGAIAVERIEGYSFPVVFAVASTTDVYAFNATNGELLWQQRAGFHPYHSVTGTPAVAEGRVYVPISSIEVGVARTPDHVCCVSSGGIVALDAKTGAQVWQMRSTLRQAELVGRSAGKSVFAPSGAPIWASPTLDLKRGLLYIGTGENYSRPATLTSDAILALNLDTGAVIWSQQMTADDAWHSGCSLQPDYAPCDDPGPDLDFGMAPIIAQTSDGTDVLLAGQKSAVVFALDPDNSGAVLWQTRVGKGSALGGIHWGMATDGRRVYVPNADRAAIIKDVNPEVGLAPGLYALDIKTGSVLWQTPTPGPKCDLLKGASARAQRAALRSCLTSNSAAPTVTDGVVFAGDLYGKLRGYDAASGDILWTYDTHQTYQARNGIDAQGGSLDGPGPVVINGRLYVNSGYASFGQRGGNVLLSFKLD